MDVHEPDARTATTRRIISWLNVAVAFAFAAVAMYGLTASGSHIDREAFGYIGVGIWFGLIASAVHAQSRIFVTLLSAPLMLALLVFMFILLFAPFAWGESNMGTVYVLWAGNILLLVLQLAGLMVVYSRNASGEGVIRKARQATAD